jgi:hypothetical protein
LVFHAYFGVVGLVVGAVHSIQTLFEI